MSKLQTVISANLQNIVIFCIISGEKYCTEKRYIVGGDFLNCRSEDTRTDGEGNLLKSYFYEVIHFRIYELLHILFSVAAYYIEK